MGEMGGAMREADPILAVSFPPAKLNYPTRSIDVLLIFLSTTQRVAKKKHGRSLRRQKALCTTSQSFLSGNLTVPT